jgi:hypothetical protein
MDSADIDAGREALRHREGIPHDKSHYIGAWSLGETQPNMILDLFDWAHARGVQGVIWTALPPKFKEVEKTPTVDQVVQYLSNLTGTKRDDAERYIRRAPPQIDTEYRRRIEAVLHWTPLDKTL